MRKITQAAAHAFFNRYAFSESNTKVTKILTDSGSIMQLYLHGNLIAESSQNGSLKFTLAGWPTQTTRERLRCIGVNISQRKGVQYLEVGTLDEWHEVIIDTIKWYDTNGNEV